MADAVHSSSDLPALAALLRAGELVAFPTETVYGLGADATNSDAVLKIYETKGRPRFNPLIVHVADLAMAETLVRFSPMARRLAQFWPGPLTLVLPRRPEAGLSDLVTAGLDTVGIRIPAHPLALELIRAAGRPLAAPSANRSGKLSPTTAAQVERSFGGSVPVLDGGASQAGVESTILAVEGDVVTQLRAGALPRDEIEAAIGQAIAVAQHDAAIAARGCWRATMRRTRHCGSMPMHLGPARPGSVSAPAPPARTCRRAATCARRRGTCSPCCTSSTRPPPASPWRRSRGAGWAKPSTIG